MSGLLIDGRSVPVPGVKVIGPHDEPWAHLAAGDGQPRTGRPNKLLLHKTVADDPERVLTGMGPKGHAQRVAEDWARDPKHSGAHIVVASEEIACLADVVSFEAYHGNHANDLSVGIEHCEERGGGVRQATLDNGVAAIAVLAAELGIQLQYHLPYRGMPLARFADGGRTLIGVFGHRDVTTARGRWDPGDLIWELLTAKLGAEAFDFQRGEDRDVWRDRQTMLNVKYRAGLVVDGLPGPATTAALRAAGWRDGIWAFGRA